MRLEELSQTLSGRLFGPRDLLVELAACGIRLHEHARSVGITGVSEPFFREMMAVGERLSRETLKVDYELVAVVQAARARATPVHLVPELVWAEIDDRGHLERARERIYPPAALGRTPGQPLNERSGRDTLRAGATWTSRLRGFCIARRSLYDGMPVALRTSPTPVTRSSPPR